MRRSRNIVDLLEEMIHEILLRLPVKTLLRCKCVCKQWRALIRSQRFIEDHFKHESNRDCLLIQRDPHGLNHRTGLEFSMYTDDGRHLRFDMPSGIISSGLLGPCNGIFCAVDPELGSIVLFNHATRKFKPLPPIPLPHLKCPEFGFGFDPFSGDYKVVVFETSVKFLNSFCVYNSSSDSWRKAEVNSSNELEVVIDCGELRRHELVMNGVYHWLILDLYILGFDMMSENFREISIPGAIIDADSTDVSMTAYGDSLALLSRNEEVGRVDLWVMGGDGLWTTPFSIALPQPNMRALCVWNKNELILDSLTQIEAQPEIQISRLALFMCDISTHQVRKVEPEFDNFSVSEVFCHKESLYSFEGERSIPGLFQDIYELGDEGEIIDMPDLFRDIFGLDDEDDEDDEEEDDEDDEDED